MLFFTYLYICYVFIVSVCCVSNKRMALDVLAHHVHMTSYDHSGGSLHGFVWDGPMVLETCFWQTRRLRCTMMVIWTCASNVHSGPLISWGNPEKTTILGISVIVKKDVYLFSKGMSLYRALWIEQHWILSSDCETAVDDVDDDASIMVIIVVVIMQSRGLRAVKEDGYFSRCW